MFRSPVTLRPVPRALPVRFTCAPAVLMLSITAAASPGARAQGAEGPGEPLLRGARCESAVREQLREWGAQLQHALGDVPQPTGLQTIRVPTGVLGLWLRLVEIGADEVAIERITATRIERLRFDEECAPAEYAVATPAVAPGAFSDSDLIARVARGGRGVFLLWSPHMPLSVDQHQVLAGVAAELGLEVVPLLDPAADADYASRMARERALPDTATRPLGGIELLFRGMATHTPSLQVFTDGCLRGPVVFGYRGAAALRETLAGVLGPK